MRDRAHGFRKLCVVLCLATVAPPPSGRVFAAERKRPDPRKRVEWLLNPSRRDQAAKPDEVVAALRLQPGQVVADIGAGPGYFALPFAKAVGAAGRVYGVDIEPHFVSELERLARLSKLSNVVPVLTAPDSPGLPPSSVDLAFLCSVYRHIADRGDYLRQLRDCLKPGGRIAVLEWRKADTLRPERRSSKRLGPPEAEKIDPAQVVRELRRAGFTVLEQPEFLEYYFFVIAGVSS